MVVQSGKTVLVGKFLALDGRGVVMLDASCVFVPRNEAYEVIS